MCVVVTCPRPQPNNRIGSVLHSHVNPTTMSSIVREATHEAPPPPQETWVEESLERYTNPLAFARKNDPGPDPEFQEEISLSSPGGQNVKLQVHMLKERPFWSKVNLFWTFRLADVEGNNSAQTVVIALMFDTWTGSVQISENAELKMDEIQKPIVGGAWTTKTDFGALEIKITPYWTGYEYALRHEGTEVYKLFA